MLDRDRFWVGKELWIVINFGLGNDSLDRDKLWMIMDRDRLWVGIDWTGMGLICFGIWLLWDALRCFRMDWIRMDYGLGIGLRWIYGLTSQWDWDWDFDWDWNFDWNGSERSLLVWDGFRGIGIGIGLR